MSLKINQFSNVKNVTTRIWENNLFIIFSVFFLFNRFCVGDRFYLCENKILCEYDYEERLVFASMANHPMLKRHANNIGQNSPQPGVGNAGGHNNNIMNLGPPQSTTAGNNQQQQQQQQQRGTSGGGDHNNNNGPSTPNSGPFVNPPHLKTTLGSSS